MMADEFVVVPSVGRPSHESYLRTLAYIWTESEVERKYQRWVGRFVIQDATVWAKMTAEEKANKFTTDECQLIVVEDIEENQKDSGVRNLSCYSLNRRVWTIRPNSRPSYKYKCNWNVARSEADANSILISEVVELVSDSDSDSESSSSVIPPEGKSYNVCFDKPNQSLLDKLVKQLQSLNSSRYNSDHDYPTATMVVNELTRIMNETQPQSSTIHTLKTNQEQLDENDEQLEGTEIYVVTEFGCDSTPSDMWVPRTYVFKDKEKAYAHYRRLAPSLEDQYNRAELRVGQKSNQSYYLEAILQVAGYHDGDGTCAKRPCGVKISKHMIYSRVRPTTASQPTQMDC